MPGNLLYDLLAPVYGRVLAGTMELVAARAWQRLAAGAPKSVLELGTGPGQFLSHVAGKFDGRIVGVDISRVMLEQARKKLPLGKGAARLTQADVRALPFPSGSFEAAGTILLFDVLGQDDVRAGLEEMSRVIAPGGRAVIGSIRFSNGFVKRGWMLAYNLLPGVIGHPRPTDVDEHLEAVGLRLLRDEEIPGLLGVRLLTLMKVVG